MISLDQIKIRKVTDVDIAKLSEIVDRVLHKNNKPWTVLFSKESALRTAKEKGIILNNSYLILFSISVPWFVGSAVLYEQAVVKLYRNDTSMNHVCAFFTYEALARGCVAVFSGSMFAYSSKGMRRLYERNGFVHEGDQMVKVL